MPEIRDAFADWLAAAAARASALAVDTVIEQVGRVEQVGDGVALISGLPGACQDELLAFAGGGSGMAISLERQVIGAVLLSAWEGIAAGSAVRGTSQVVRVPVGEGLLGRAVDPLGHPLDGGPPITADRYDPVDRPAPPIIARDAITTPLHTGILAIDAMIPLGRGQRELIIGDRQTGKTAIAVDAMIAQRWTDVVCVYAAVGQKASSVNQVMAAVREQGAPERTVLVVGAADGPPGLQWIAPYAACTMAEYFRDRGQDALLVIDDLTKHAAAYRQLSLLLRRPPGREAYPGDIFYIHSRLLERSAKLATDLGGGSLTALPIAETQGGSLTAYIPTNLISITDGQIYLEPKLFHEGLKPAIDVAKSVSRVGGKTQAPAINVLARSLRLDYAQFMELEAFTRFGAVVDETTRKTIDHGRRIRAILGQPQYRPLRLAEEVALLLAVDEGLLDALSEEAVERFRHGLGPYLDARARALCLTLEASGKLDDETRTALAAVLADLAATAGEP
jgi:F-type H+-transporting ATPase subunit alpha